MKRITLILLVLFLAVGVAFAKDYTVIKKAGSYMVQVKIDKNPPVTGKNAVDIMIKNSSGAYVTDATVAVEYGMPAMPGMPAMHYKTKAELKNNQYLATLNFSMAGAWYINLEIMRAGKTQSVKLNVDVS